MAHRNYFLLGFLMLCGFTVVGQLYVTIPLVSDIASRFDVTPESAAFASSAFGFVSFFGGAQVLNAERGIDLQTLRLVGLPPLLLTLVAAPITRKFGPSVTARIGLSIMAAALVVAITGTAKVILTASIILSSGIALAVPGLIATIAGQTTHENRGLALAIYTFTLFFGASIAPPTAQVLASYGVGTIWLLPAILQAAAVFAITVGLRRRSLSASTTS